MRVAASLGVTAAAAVACAPPAVTRVQDPAGAHRFEILAVGDTTFTMLVSGAPWVRGGQIGLAVDPRRRDALVARFLVQGRQADTAVALVTGQTARVATTHIALLNVPPARVSRFEAFWLGVVAGGALGAAAAILAR